MGDQGSTGWAGVNTFEETGAMVMDRAWGALFGGEAVHGLGVGRSDPFPGEGGGVRSLTEETADWMKGVTIALIVLHTLLVTRLRRYTTHPHGHKFLYCLYLSSKILHVFLTIRIPRPICRSRAAVPPDRVSTSCSLQCARNGATSTSPFHVTSKADGACKPAVPQHNHVRLQCAARGNDCTRERRHL